MPEIAKVVSFEVGGSKHAKTFDEVLERADLYESSSRLAGAGIAGDFMRIAQTQQKVDQYLKEVNAAEVRRAARIKESLAKRPDVTESEARLMLRLPGVWTNTKSKIKRMWVDFKTHPRKFDTFSQLSMELNAKQKGRRARDLSKTPSVLVLRELMKRVMKLPEGERVEIAGKVEAMVTKFEAEAIVATTSRSTHKPAVHAGSPARQ